MSVPVAVGAALVLSHLAALPALIYLGVRQRLNETVILSITVLTSVLYHMCQVEWACFGLDLHALQISDHFMVFFSLIWFLLYAAGSSERVRTAVSIAVMGVSLPVIISHIDTWFAGIAVTSLAVLAFVVTFAAYARVRKGVRVEWRAFTLSIVLISVGVSIHVFAGDFGPDNTVYPIAHTVWHVLAFLSLYYIAMIPFVHTSVLFGDGFARLNAYRAAFKQALHSAAPQKRAKARVPREALSLAPGVVLAPLQQQPHPPPQQQQMPPHSTGQGTYLTLDGVPSVLNYYRGDEEGRRHDDEKLRAQ
jgi:hypothetical protein